MSIGTSRFGALSAGVLWMLGAGLPAVADDTELFIRGGADAGARPNVLFIIDNSASMDTEVVTQDSYDPSTDYAGDCRDDRVYYRVGSGAAPACDTHRWFDWDALKCQAAKDAFTRGGQFIDKLLQYDPDHRIDRPRDTGQRWELLDANFRSRPVECRRDAGVHGVDATGSDKYARDGSSSASGYWGGANDEITWDDRHNDETYTLYSANYLNWARSPSVRKTRLEIVQDVAASLINSIDGINVGLMYFNPFENDGVGSQGGLVAHAMENVATARETIIDKINGLEAGAFTPLSETLYEAALYYSGGEVRFGARSVEEARLPSDRDRYRSPITDPCQQSFIVYLTDGEPTLDVAANEEIAAMVDDSGNTFGSLVGTCDREGDENGMCLDDLAKFLYEGDSSPLPDYQSITTHTIGFAIDLPVLERTAERGNGVYYTANDTADLANALTNILAAILDTSQTFASPGVAVDAFNRTQNLSDLFIGVFGPTPNRHWHGNLKKYSLRAGDATIIDANERPAVDPGTGFFFPTAQSYWSPTPDGNSVIDGGAANVLPAPGQRKIYTYLELDADLTHASNLVVDDNAFLTDEMLDLSGASGEPTREDLFRFIRGEDFEDWNERNGDTDDRNQLGDPLHSQPVAAIYGPGQRDGLLFFATNDGFLHALDLATGIEQWAFIPKEFLRDQLALYDNEVTSEKHYGIDGELRIHMIGDHDNMIESGERVFLYVGMGRGGDFYYALDVTAPRAPKLLWKLDGATLPKLGQTWAMPIPTRIDIQGAAYAADNREQHVLVIAGGYEADQDLPAFSADSVGNALYVVDAYSGALLWSASNSGTAGRAVSQTFAAPGRSMDYSIPARIRVLDVDGDGYADRFYAGDMGGQVWRFDVRNGRPAGSLVAGGVIAQLGGAPSAASPAGSIRRFYNAPDIAAVNTRSENFIHLGIGSGHRGHPLNATNEDRFYALRDYRIPQMTQGEFDALTPVTDAMLTPVTTTDTTVRHGSPGWRLDLNVGTGWAGEKVLAEARTFDNQVIFSTFRPGTAGAVSCKPRLGVNRIYRMNLFNGAPVTNLDASTDPNEPLAMSDLYVENAGGILSAPQALFIDDDGIPDVDKQDGNAVICVGLICFPAGLKNTPVRTFWVQEALD